MRKECPLCKNNPNKKCREDDNFDECYADGQVLKSKCEADVFLELVNLRTGVAEALPGVDIAVGLGKRMSGKRGDVVDGHVSELQMRLRSIRVLPTIYRFLWWTASRTTRTQLATTTM